MRIRPRRVRLRPMWGIAGLVVAFLILTPIYIGAAWCVYLASKAAAVLIVDSPTDQVVMASIAVAIAARLSIGLYRSWKEA